MHAGHIELFRFAKRNGCGLLVIGLENDKNIQASKGNNRPFLNYKQRSEVLSEISSIDLIFPIKEKVNFGSKKAKEVYKNLYQKIQPDFLVTNKKADKYWKRKKKIAKGLGFKILLDNSERINSSTAIGKKLEI